LRDGKSRRDLKNYNHLKLIQKNIFPIKRKSFSEKWIISI